MTHKIIRILENVDFFIMMILLSIFVIIDIPFTFFINLQFY
jgi:hypothetical protein